MEQHRRRIEDPAVDDVVKRVRTVRDREFNDEVAEAARAIQGAVIRARVTKIGGKRMLVDRRDVGDIDVLVVLREVGCVLALETKNLLPSLNAYAMAHERARLAGPGGTIELHSRRLAWLIDNGEAISREFGSPPGDSWRVQDHKEARDIASQCAGPDRSAAEAWKTALRGRSHPAPHQPMARDCIGDQALARVGGDGRGG